MKNLIILFLLFNNLLIAQEHIFVNPDKKPKCSIMKNGTFSSINYTFKQYHMVVKNGIQTEYLENGQYVMSKMEFLNECEYKTTVLKVTIPNYFVKPGDHIITKILQTQHEYIKVKSVYLGKEFEFVFIKME